MSVLVVVGKLDKDTILFHDALDILTRHPNNALVINFGTVERNLGRQLLLEQRQTVKGTGHRVGTEVDQKVVVVERFKLDFDIGGLHNFGKLAILLSCDKVTVLIGQLNLESNLVMEGLRGPING